MVSKGFPNVITSGRQYNIGEKPSVILYTYINLLLLFLTFSVLVVCIYVQSSHMLLLLLLLIHTFSVLSLQLKKLTENYAPTSFDQHIAEYGSTG